MSAANTIKEVLEMIVNQEWLLEDIDDVDLLLQAGDLIYTYGMDLSADYKQSMEDRYCEDDYDE